MLDITIINEVKRAIDTDLDNVLNAQLRVKESLLKFADGKNLKGDELTAWLGEIFAKILFGGTLVDESHEHDFIVLETGERYAVKARKGRNSGWTSTSAISKIVGEDSPHFLLFIHFNSQYEIENIWKYDWQEMRAADRFKLKVVRGESSRCFFYVAPTKDMNYLVYSRNSINRATSR